MTDIFISYASEDRASAGRLAKALEDQGWSVWWDPEIPAGKTYAEVIEQALEAAKSIVVLWSRHAVDSRWVQTEASEGADRRILVPVLIEEVRIPLEFKRIQAANLVEWDGTVSHPVLQKLVSDIAVILGPPPVAAEAERCRVEEEKQRKEKEEEAKREADLDAKRKIAGERVEQAEEESAQPKVEEAAALRRVEPELPIVAPPRPGSPLNKFVVLGGIVVAAVLLTLIIPRGYEITPPTPSPDIVDSPTSKPTIKPDGTTTAKPTPTELLIDLSQSQWREVQTALKDIGFDVGPSDGIHNDKTRSAITLFQESRGFPGSGELTEAQLTRLLSDARKAAHGQLGGADGPAMDPVPLPEMVQITAGCFQMGSPPGEGRHSERPQHRVCVGAFAMGRYEVTFDEYDRFAETSGRKKPHDRGWGRSRRPVINVTWGDAVAYAEWLSGKTGKLFRLPTEAEWEYVTRAGTKTPFWTGNCINTDQANYDGNYGYKECGANTGVYRGKTEPTGTLVENPWGLHEVHGNVWEWVADCWHNDYGKAPGDGFAWKEGELGDCGRRVIRGGSWIMGPRVLRSASRDWSSTDNRSGDIGFRLAQDL